MRLCSRGSAAPVRSAALVVACFAALLLLAMPVLARAQTSPVDDINVHTPPPVPDANPATPITPNLKVREGSRLRVDVSLVVVPVTVTDGLNRLVTGLDKENFFVYEDGVLQTVKAFSTEDAPCRLASFSTLAAA